MRTFFGALRFVAVVNLLAIAGFAAWLWGSGRLDVERVAALRDLLAPTRAELDAKAVEASAAAAQAEAMAQEEQLRLDPPPPSAAVVARTELAGSRTILAQRAANDDERRILDQLESRRRQLDAREAELATDRASWEALIDVERDRRVDAQFTKTVRQYESAPPKVAREWILELDRRGEIEQVVAYIDAMQPRAASRILKELEGESEERLATDLLERLRTFGIDPRGDEAAPNDRTDASTNAPRNEPQAPSAN